MYSIPQRLWAETCKQSCARLLFVLLLVCFSPSHIARTLRTHFRYSPHPPPPPAPYFFVTCLFQSESHCARTPHSPPTIRRFRRRNGPRILFCYLFVSVRVTLRANHFRYLPHPPPPRAPYFVLLLVCFSPSHIARALRTHPPLLAASAAATGPVFCFVTCLFQSESHCAHTSHSLTLFTAPAAATGPTDHEPGGSGTVGPWPPARVPIQRLQGSVLISYTYDKKRISSYHTHFVISYAFRHSIICTSS